MFTNERSRQPKSSPPSSRQPGITRIIAGNQQQARDLQPFSPLGNRGARGKAPQTTPSPDEENRPERGVRGGGRTAGDVQVGPLGNTHPAFTASGYRREEAGSECVR